MEAYEGMTLNFMCVSLLICKIRAFDNMKCKTIILILWYILQTYCSHVAQVVKNPPADAGDTRCWLDPWVRKILWRRKWQPTPFFLPGESHGQRSLMGYSPCGCKESDMTEATVAHTHICSKTSLQVYKIFSPIWDYTDFQWPILIFVNISWFGMVNNIIRLLASNRF